MSQGNVKYIGYSLVSVIISNCLSILLVPLIAIMPHEKHRLIKLVEDRETELAFIELWKTMKKRNLVKSIIGFFLLFLIWGFMFYYVFTFTNIYYNWKLTILYGFLIGLAFDFFLFEILIEAAISMYYWCFYDKGKIKE